MVPQLTWSSLFAILYSLCFGNVHPLRDDYLRPLPVIFCSYNLFPDDWQMETLDIPSTPSSLEKKILSTVKQKDKFVMAQQTGQFKNLAIAYLSLLLVILFILFRMRQFSHRLYLIEQKHTGLAPQANHVLTPAGPQETAYPLPLNPEKNEETGRPENPSLALYNQILELIEREKLYLKPDLDQKMIIQKLGTNKTYVYNAINTHSTQNFKRIINHLRVEEAKRVIQQLVLDKKTMNYELIMQLSGFNSKTTFYRIFKLQVGMSPSDYAEMCAAYPDSI